MKYLMKLEELWNEKNEIYWKIQTTLPNMEIALNKIGMDKEDIEDWLNKTLRNRYVNHQYIFLFKDIYSNAWQWSELDYNSTAKYMGEIEITPEEIDEYNMKQSAKKYNLT